MPQFEYGKDYPFAAFITNLGKYNEGELVGEWVKFPTTAEELKKVFDRIGIGQKDDFGQPYEEWFITDYDCYVGALYDKLGEYENLDELNYLASKLEEMGQGEYAQFQAAMEVGDHSGSLQEIINLTENLDCYDLYPSIQGYDDLGRYYIEELDAMQVPEHLRNYIDYEAYGRDVAMDESGDFTDLGYVRDTGDTFHEYYDGEPGSIPEEYRVMTFQDDIPEEELSEWAMDIAYDMDEFFRQRDPQYAAEHPEEHAAKEEIYENLMAGRISALDEKLADLGQTQDDYLPSELEKFKEASGYEEVLDVTPETAPPLAQEQDSDDRDGRMMTASAELAADIDHFFRQVDTEYAAMFPDDTVQKNVLQEYLDRGDTSAIKTGLINAGRERDLADEAAPLIGQIDAYEKEFGINTYMVYQLQGGDKTRDLRFEPLDSIKAMGHTVDAANYELVYAAPFTPGETLETIYQDLNRDRPDNFHGHSLSVSDVVVLREYGKETAYYCDRSDFVQVPEFLQEQQRELTPDALETGETVRTPRGTFYVTDMSQEQMEAAGYGFHHQSEDGNYLIMGNGSRAFAIRNGEAQEHAAPEKMTVLVVEPMKEPYVKEIDPGLHALQAEVGGDIGAAYPFRDPVALVCNDEGKLIGLDLNRGLRDENGELYDIMAGTFLVVGLGEEDFASLSPELAQKYMEHFRQPEQFISLGGQIIALPVEPEKDNPLRTAEMTLEDDYGMIDGVINNGRRGEETEKAAESGPGKKPSIRERLEDAKKECSEHKPPEKGRSGRNTPEHGSL